MGWWSSISIETNKILQGAWVMLIAPSSFCRLGAISSAEDGNVNFSHLGEEEKSIRRNRASLASVKTCDILISCE